jgi:Flp pilus assembly pilin Flp
MKLFADEEGATLVEYALMLGLIVVVCAAIVGVLGGKVGNLYNSVKPGFPD